MSSVSITSRESNVVEARQELESLRAMNSSLKLYLDQLRLYKKSLLTMTSNLGELKNINEEWVEVMRTEKSK